MDTKLLRQLGNIDQLAGVRESRLSRGAGEGLSAAEFYNAAGLRFTLLPDRCLDILELSYRGVNFSFQTKNGVSSNHAFQPQPQEFADHWPGGMLFTCGLDNVGGGADEGRFFPTHGRIGSRPVERLSLRAEWEGDEYILSASGEARQSRLNGCNLGLRRTVSTTLNAKSLLIRDVVTNYEPADEPLMLLYHFNFGYPLLSPGAVVYASDAELSPLNALSADPMHIIAPEDGRDEELYLRAMRGGRAYAALVNPTLRLGAYLAFDPTQLPYLLQWKNMRAHDYVLGLEPCNTGRFGRVGALKDGAVPFLRGYESLLFELELGVLDGQEEIDAFLQKLSLGDRMRVELIETDKKRFLPLLLLADEQESMIDRYLARGRLYAMYDGGEEPVCIAVVTVEGEGVAELKNIATDPAHQGRGYGRRMIEHVCNELPSDITTLTVGTGDSPLTIPFYEKCGFVQTHRIKNFFIDHYDHPMYECGKQLIDMVYLKKDLSRSGRKG